MEYSVWNYKVASYQDTDKLFLLPWHSKASEGITAMHYPKFKIISVVFGKKKAHPRLDRRYHLRRGHYAVASSAIGSI